MSDRAEAARLFPAARRAYLIAALIREDAAIFPAANRPRLPPGVPFGLLQRRARTVAALSIGAASLPGLGPIGPAQAADALAWARSLPADGPAWPDTLPEFPE